MRIILTEEQTGKGQCPGIVGPSNSGKTTLAGVVVSMDGRRGLLTSFDPSSTKSLMKHARFDPDCDVLLMNEFSNALKSGDIIDKEFIRYGEDLSNLLAEDPHYKYKLYPTRLPFLLCMQTDFFRGVDGNVVDYESIKNCYHPIHLRGGKLPDLPCVNRPEYSWRTCHNESVIQLFWDDTRDKYNPVPDWFNNAYKTFKACNDQADTVKAHNREHQDKDYRKRAYEDIDKRHHENMTKIAKHFRPEMFEADVADDVAAGSIYHYDGDDAISGQEVSAIAKDMQKLDDGIDFTNAQD